MGLVIVVGFALSADGALRCANAPYGLVVYVIASVWFAVGSLLIVLYRSTPIFAASGEAEEAD